MASTKERENFVYVAKLAEQAERYDGLFLLLLTRSSIIIIIIFSFSCFETALFRLVTVKA